MKTKTIYLNFQNLTEETKDQILADAINAIYNNKEEINEIEKTYGKNHVNEIVRERAEANIYNYNYVFNV